LVTGAVVLPLAVGLLTLGLLLRRRDEERDRRASLDPLTQLPNRNALSVRARKVLAGIDSLDTDGSRGPALLLVDLDGFKDINDILGHVAGDAVLVQVAAQLDAASGPGAMVARLGGDEFAILLPGPLTTAQATLAAKTILAGLGAGDFRAHEVALDVRASIGIALAPRHGRTLAELLKHADVAMYESKRARSGVTVYEHDLDPHAADRLGTLALLRGAMDAGQLHLRYQPVVRAQDCELLGFEALVRWQHPTRGLMLPAEFVPLAERTSLIHPLTRWVLLTALRQAATWRDEGLDVTIAVNISPVTLELGLLGIVEEALARSRWPAQRLILEVTETAITENPDVAKSVVTALRERGVQVSVDDFGAGFTSLGLLSGLPVHQLKIDRQFIDGLGGNHHDAVVSSIIELGHKLGLVVVAEGVETESSFRQLRRLGCDELQGFLFSRPMPSDDIHGWVAGHRSTPLPAPRSAPADDASPASV
jgi:diguanylate cyclase (GGDEF)-like protein